MSSTVIAGVATLSMANYAQAQSSSNACERWLCMPASTVLEIAKGSNPTNANCFVPYLDYTVRVVLPWRSAMTNFENCIDSDYYDRHPEMEVKGDVDTPGFFGGNWEEYELEVFENGIKRGEVKFDHHKNRVFLFISQDDPKKRVVRDVKSNGDFGNTLMFPLGR